MKRWATNLGHADDLAIRTPARMFEELGYLSSFPGTRLAHDYRDWICLDEIE